MVDLYDAAPKLMLSSTPDWYEKSKWFYNVNEEYGSFEPLPEAQEKVNEIAKNSINEIGLKFASRDDLFSKADTMIKLYVNDKHYHIKISATDTLGDVAQKIIDETKGDINASIMKTGEGDSAYSLMINSKETGASNNIYFGNTLVSKDIMNGALSLVDGDLSITMMDSNGVNKTFSINVSNNNTESRQNANILKEAIITAIKRDADMAKLLENGDISVDVSGDGKRIILNDKRGFGINIGGTKSNQLFTNNNISEDDTIVGKTQIASGLITGVITIGNKNLDLSTITSAKNTKEMNETAIISAINAIDGYYAKLNKDGYLTINTNTGEVIIKSSEGNGEALKKLGLESGKFMDWSVFAKKLNIMNIQQASNANITYNGVSISRPKNTIDDIASGITLELLSPSDKDINVSIGRNNSMIVEEIKAFVEGYNQLIPKLDELTRYDEDTKIAGIFNSVGDIKTIKGSLHRALASTSFVDGRYESMIDYGLSFNDNGLLILDESKLQSALATDSDKVRDFFRGGTTTINGKEVQTQGIFSLVLKELDNLTTGDNSRLKLFEESIKNDDKRLKADRARNLELLNSRYEIMANRFAAYDSQIARANNSFNSLNMMIEQSIADKKKN